MFKVFMILFVISSIVAEEKAGDTNLSFGGNEGTLSQNELNLNPQEGKVDEVQVVQPVPESTNVETPQVAQVQDEAVQPVPESTNVETPSPKVVQVQDPLTVTNITEIDITIGGIDVGTIRMGIFGNTYPITSVNHVHLCNQTFGYGYHGAIFHRTIKDFMIQGGDYTNEDGTGGHSIYVVDGNYVYFKDEDMSLVKHYGAGFVSMANAGPNTNGAQFVIQTVETPWLNGHHVVFGKVLKGMRIVDLIQNIRTNKHDRPFKNVVIKSCRVMPAPAPFTVDKLAVPMDQE